MAKNFIEPTLSDLLDDPLTAVMMARDGVSRDALLELIETVAARLAPPVLHEEVPCGCYDLSFAG